MSGEFLQTANGWWGNLVSKRWWVHFPQFDSNLVMSLLCETRSEAYKGDAHSLYPLQSLSNQRSPDRTSSLTNTPKLRHTQGPRSIRRHKRTIYTPSGQRKQCNVLLFEWTWTLCRCTAAEMRTQLNLHCTHPSRQKGAGCESALCHKCRTLNSIALFCRAKACRGNRTSTWVSGRQRQPARSKKSHKKSGDRTSSTSKVNAKWTKARKGFVIGETEVQSSSKEKQSQPFFRVDRSREARK